MTDHREHEADPLAEADDRDEAGERPRESYPNPTQQRIDEEGASDAPADVSWDEERWGDQPEPGGGEPAGGWPETADSPHEGEEGQRDAV